MTLPDAVSGSLMAVDIERFGDPHRDNSSGFQVIAAFYRVLREAFAAASLPWDKCTVEDRGDGALIFVPSTFAAVLLIDPWLGWLSTALDGHNRKAALGERFRLRIALHRGETLRTEHGHTGDNTVLVCRLLDAAPLRTALRHATGDLALIVSEDVYDNIIRHGYRNIDPAKYHPVSVTVKRTRARAWIHLPGSTEAPVIDNLPAAPASAQPDGPPDGPPAPGGLHVTGSAKGTRSIGVKIDKLEWT